MAKSDIKKFYEAAVAQKKFSKEFFNELKGIETEGKLKVFIEKKVQPVAKEMGYHFSTEELLNYEKQMARKITEKQLEAISGGIDVKNIALGGIVSLMALGAGIVASTSSASAQLDKDAVSGSIKAIEIETDKKFEIPQAPLAEQKKEKTQVSRKRKAKETTQNVSQTQQKEEPLTKETSKQKDTKVEKAPQAGTEESQHKEENKITATKSWYGSWLCLTTDSKSSKNLNLNRSDLERFLKEAGFKDISEIQAIQAKNANREVIDVILSEDLKEIFSDSENVPGKLWGSWGKANLKKQATGEKFEEKKSTKDKSFSVSPKDVLSAAASAAPEDAQSGGEVADLGVVKSAAPVDPAKVPEYRQLTEEQKLYVYEALNLQEAYSLLQSGVIENLRICGNIMEIETVDGIRRYTADQGDAFTSLLYMLYPSNDGNLNPTGGGNRLHFSEHDPKKYISPELMAKFCAFVNDYRNTNKEIFTEKNKLEEVKNLLEIKQTAKSEQPEYVKPSKKGTQYIFDNSATQLLYKYGIVSKPGSDFKITENTPKLSSKQVRLYGLFMWALKGAVDLEEAEDSPYPKYLTERILMSYMIKTLNTPDEVIKLYQEITKQLALNETNTKPLS